MTAPDRVISHELVMAALAAINQQIEQQQHAQTTVQHVAQGRR